MKLMNRLERDLGALFNPPPARSARKDPCRKTRELAKKLAAEHGIKIEKFREGGMNVWPPAGIDAKEDPYDEDHYVSDWDEALPVVEAYVKLLSARTG